MASIPALVASDGRVSAKVHAPKHTAKRKPVVSETHQFVEGTRVFRLHLEEIEDIADEFSEVASDPQYADREPSAVVARRRHLSEATVDRCIGISRHAHKRAYHAQRTGMLNAMNMAGATFRATLEGR